MTSSLSDRASFEVFYAEHRGSIGRALVVTLRDDHLASEALDEAMLRAYQRWAEVRRLESPSGWVYTVGLNWSRSVLRRMSRSQPLGVNDPLKGSNQFADPDVDRALQALTVDQRAVVVCRYLIGYSEAETARVLNIRPGTVKSRLHRALNQLHSLLKDREISKTATPGDEHD